MDVGTLGAISTVLVTIAFFGVCFWAFSPKLKKRFEDDANLPFADEKEIKHTDDHQAADDVEGRK
ncbi:cbb3-type cytochrome oxidase subunit 3 [Cellvibrio sp.]|uniref:cbb3-type cytochrome oxidase subunit 3 n=1 Tax=Cellvibrio sp. TaxID=1965322 RepID=UPI0039648430